MDGVQDLWEGEYTYRCIMTNDYESSAREIIEFYNLRGGKERIFDDMNNGFGWDRLPKSFMAENTVFLLLTALIRNFYKAIIQRLDVIYLSKHCYRYRYSAHTALMSRSTWLVQR